MVDRIRLEEFRARFGIATDAEALARFRKRVVHAALTSLNALPKDDRISFEKEFAFRNGSDVVFGQNWGGGLDLRHGVIEELERAKTFIQLIERLQQLLWTFEAFGLFKDKQRYGNRDYAGLVFAGELGRAIELSPGIDLRLQNVAERFELAPAGVQLLDDAVDTVTQWLSGFPDVEKEYRQTLRILAEKRRDQYRQAQDGLRFALEKLLKLLLTNNSPLESQGRPLKVWLASRGVTEPLRDLAVQIMVLVTKQYQNTVVKHDNSVADGVAKTWSDHEVEYILYQYTTLLRLILEASHAADT
jgi:hypothetical protein